MSVPLTVPGLARKLDEIAADQASLKDGQSQQTNRLDRLEAALAEGFARLAEVTARQADVLDTHTEKLNALIQGQSRQTQQLDELIQLMRGQQSGT